MSTAPSIKEQSCQQRIVWLETTLTVLAQNRESSELSLKLEEFQLICGVSQRVSGDADVQEVQEIRLRDPWLYKLRMGGRFAREGLAQMLNSLVSAPKVLVEASGRHMLALNASRFLSTL